MCWCKLLSYMHQHFTCLPGAHFSRLAASWLKTPQSLGSFINSCRIATVTVLLLTLHERNIADLSPQHLRLFSGLARDACAEIHDVRSFCLYPAVWISH